MEKVEILEVFNGSPKSYQHGIQRYVNNLCKLFEEDKNINLIKINELPRRNIPFINKVILDTKLLEKELLNKKYKFIHIHGFADMVVWQALKIAIRNKLQVIYSPFYHPFGTLAHPFRGMIFFYFFIRKYLKHITKIITVNNEDTSFFSLYSEKVIRIPLWHEKIELCEDYAKVQNRILFVGRSASNKGLEYLALLDNKKYDIHCVISNYRNENYIIHNEISDVQLQNLYQSSSLLIVPSKYESFSLVALESLVCGTPILVSDKVRITDYLTGVSGVTIFEYGNKDDFLEKIDIAMKQRVNLDMVDNIFSSKMAYNNYRKIFMDT